MRRGENIRKRKDGRWEGRYRENGEANYHSVYGKTYKEVKIKLNGLKQSSPKKVFSKAVPTFQILCDEWLSQIKISIKQSTYAQYHTTINEHLIPLWRNSNLNKIDFQTDLQSFIEQKYKEGLSVKRIKEIISRAKQILSYAYKQKYLSYCDLDIQLPKSTVKEIEVLSKEEQQQFVDYILQNMECKKIGVLLSLFLGLRIGEVCALKWSDIDINNQILKISRTMQRIKNLDTDYPKTKIIIDTPKSEKSKRSIPIPYFLFQLLYNLKYDNPDCFILTGMVNTFIEPRSYENKFKMYLKEAGIRTINYHALRHTFATRAVEKKIDIKLLSELLGHSNVTLTLQLYVHPTMQEKRDSIEQIAS